jgi:hypothetical protein
MNRIAPGTAYRKMHFPVAKYDSLKQESARKPGWIPAIAPETKWGFRLRRTRNDGIQRSSSESERYPFIA